MDTKTAELACLAVLAALRVEPAVAFHAQAAKQAGASRDEVMSATLLGLPAAGQRVAQVMAVALSAYDSDQDLYSVAAQ